MLTPWRVCLLLALAPPIAAGAQSDTTRSADTTSKTAAVSTQFEVTEESPSSPRSELRRYLEAARRGDFARAAAFLDVPDSLAADGPLLARRLKLVLDHYAWIDLDAIAAGATGDTTDRLTPGVDQVATITNAGARDPVRMRQTPPGLREDVPAWRFTRATVERIPAWYGSIDNRWLVERLPAQLLRAGPFELLWWQWLALLPLLFVAWGVGSIVGRLVHAMLASAAGRTSSDMDEMIFERLSGPIRLCCQLAAAAALLSLLDLYAPAEAGAYRLIRAGFAAVFFWALWRAIDVGRQFVARTTWARTAPSSRSLVPLAARISKVVVAALALIATFSMLGYPVASLIAGLGIGGLAVALAAQKTVENLFGAFSIGIDQPFREGDFVHVDDFVGTVEAIGLRSTRFRTLDRTIVSLPNGQLADMRLESFAVRDRLRLATVIGLVYETTAAQMREVLSGLERVLRAHPKIWPDAVVVRFAELAPSSLNIEVMAWFETSDWGEFQLIRQELLLEFMDVVERAGTAFAFPTTTVHVAPQSPFLPPSPRLASTETRRA